MIRKFFRKLASKKDKFDHLLEKYNLPRSYFNINRKMITRGVAIGLFWGFIPMPMQMLAVLATTPLIRFNIPLAIVIVWLSNPFTMPFMYYMEYLTGNLILGQAGIADMKLTLDWFSTHIGDIFIPLYVGTAFYSIVISTLVYLLLNYLWIRSVHSEISERKNIRKEKENPKKD